jgi:protocatechuate 3,4-dioxygenase beta subunit
MGGVHIRLEDGNCCLPGGTCPGTYQAYGAISRPDGHFSIAGVRAAAYYFSARASGFVYVREAYLPAPSLWLHPGVPITGLKVEMTPRSVIRGRVLDGNGDPVPNAWVGARPPASPRASWDLMGGRLHTTNDLGEFRISGVPGQYRIWVSSEGLQDDAKASYYPDGTSAAEAAVVEAAPGAEVAGIDIHLHLDRLPNKGPGISGTPQIPTEPAERPTPHNSSNADNSDTGAITLGAGSVLPVQGEQPAAGKAAIVEGQVVNAITGDPVPLAMVELTSIDGSIQHITKADGTFSIHGIPPARYVARAQHTGFSSPQGHTKNGVPFDAGPGETKSGLRLQLLRNGAIAGRVIDADGQPVEDIDVQVEGRTPVDRTATTDDQGRFHLRELLPGKYTVRAAPLNTHAPPEIRTDGTVEFQEAPTYFPSSIGKGGAAGVTVTAGAETGGVEVRLIRTKVIGIKGKVIGGPAGASTGYVRALGDPTRYSSSNVRSDGSFELWRLEPGKYELVAEWGAPKGGQQSVSARTGVEVTDSSVEGVTLRYVPPADIRGMVKFDDEHARPRSNRQAPEDLKVLPRLRVSSVGMYIPDLDDGKGENGLVAADGSFTLRQIPPGRYEVTAEWGPVYIKSMRLGAVEMQDGVLDVSRGVPAGAQLTVVVSSAFGEVSGRVTAAQGPVYAMAGVVLVRADHKERVMVAGVQPDGTYAFQDVPPGRYKLVLIDMLDWDGDVDIQDAADSKNGPEPDESRETAGFIEIHAGERITRDIGN